MNLYEIPRNSRLKIEFEDGWHTCLFHHPDGMYSYCTIEDSEEKTPFHLSVLTPMVMSNDAHGTYYTIEEKDKK